MEKLTFSFKKLQKAKEFIEPKFSNKYKYGPNIIDKNENIVQLSEGDVVLKDDEGNLSVESK